MHCRECGSPVNNLTEICTNCGVRPTNGTNFCQSCGAETKEKQELCTNCGTRLIANQVNASNVVVEEDNPSGLLNAVGCCFPLVGLILFLVWKDNKPMTSKAIGKWALIGFIVGTVLGIGLYVVMLLIGLSVANLSDSGNF